MNPVQFDTLAVGDRVHSSKTGRTFTVLHKTAKAATLGAFECILPDNSACEWNLLGAPTEATITRREYPPLFIMQRDLFAAGYLKVEGHTGSFWKSGPGTVEFTFSSINQAFDHMKDSPAPTFKRPLESARTPRPPSLPEMRNALKSAGWTLRPGNRVLWQCPTGIPYGNTHFSYRVMKSWEKD